jgi:sigma-B regulation protein RsbU (phosphoserine phosphatase)
MKPAKEIGGDYFDYITFTEDPNKLGIVIADVTGKGVDAGMVMGMTKSTIHALSEENLTTRDLVLKLNRHLCTLLKKQKFISLVFAEYSAENGTFTWAGAGHEHVLVVRHGQKGDHEVEAVVTGGVVLGVFDDIEDDITQKSLTLRKGDKIILYTDGVTEARNADNEMFTLEQLVEIIRQEPSLSAHDLLSHINKKLQQFIDDTPQYDDITLVVMEKT